MGPSCLMLLATLATFGQVPAKGASPGTDPRCGSYSLYVALKAMDLAPATFADLEKKLGPPVDKGYSMAQLDEAARSYGASTMAVETTLNNLRWRPEPFTCIALLEREHFVVVYDVDDSVVSMIDVPQGLKIPVETFDRAWTKKALLIGPAPLVPEESIREPWSPSASLGWLLGVAALVVVILVGRWLWARRDRSALSPTIASLIGAAIALGAAGCADRRPAGAGITDRPAVARPKILIEPAHHDLGNVTLAAKDEPLEIKTAIVNEGDAPLKIAMIRPKCDCTDLVLDRSDVPPGEHAVLATRIKLGHEPGPRTTGLTIESTDPARPAVEVTFTCSGVSALRTEPPAVEEAQLIPGVGATLALDLWQTDLPLCDRCELVTLDDSALIECHVEPTAMAATADGHQGTANAKVGTVRVRLLASDEIQVYRQRVSLIVRCGADDRARIDVPLVWSVRPIVEITPRRLSLGLCRPGDRSAQKLVLSTRDGAPFRVLKITCDDPALQAIRHDDDARPRHVVEFAVEPPGHEGPWQASLRIETDRDEARTLDVPISALVAASTAP